jgi:histidinol-phosphatase (PHP family)
MIDCHVHTLLCRHAVGDPLEYVAAAEAAGVGVLTFTDHLPLIDGSETDYAMRWHEFPGYVADIMQLRARAADPEVLLGVEADWRPGEEALLRETLESHPFDVVLGSVHFIDDWAFDDPDLTARYSEWDIDSLWMRYFGELADAARSGLFDVMAHPDLIKKFRYMPTFDPTALYEEAALAFADGGVAIEVNTAGLRKPCAELYPSQAFLEICRRHGVPASVGSDAHNPEDVGAGWAEAREALQLAGYDSIVVFRERVPHERGIDE